MKSNVPNISFGNLDNMLGDIKKIEEKPLTEKIEM